MDARIQNEADLQKLVHCEIIKAEHMLINGVAALSLVLRAFDETVFSFSIVPGADVNYTAGNAHIRPNITYITKEVLDGSHQASHQDS